MLVRGGPEDRHRRARAGLGLDARTTADLRDPVTDADPESQPLGRNLRLGEAAPVVPHDDLDARRRPAASEGDAPLHAARTGVLHAVHHRLHGRRVDGLRDIGRKIVVLDVVDLHHERRRERLRRRHQPVGQRVQAVDGLVLGGRRLGGVEVPDGVGGHGRGELLLLRAAGGGGREKRGQDAVVHDRIHLDPLHLGRVLAHSGGVAGESLALGSIHCARRLTHHGDDGEDDAAEDDGVDGVEGGQFEPGPTALRERPHDTVGDRRDERVDDREPQRVSDRCERREYGAEEPDPGLVVGEGARMFGQQRPGDDRREIHHGEHTHRDLHAALHDREDHSESQSAEDGDHRHDAPGFAQIAELPQRAREGLQPEDETEGRHGPVGDALDPRPAQRVAGLRLLQRKPRPDPARSAHCLSRDRAREGCRPPPPGGAGPPSWERDDPPRRT
ncbi:hypothetical protein SAMN04515692_10454 [Leifsonia sp. CL147]|nr:hypothetical protein SAMN04515692_10454 [Leifsonia sp. CL147]